MAIWPGFSFRIGCGCILWFCLPEDKEFTWSYTISRDIHGDLKKITKGVPPTGYDDALGDTS